MISLAPVNDMVLGLASFTEANIGAYLDAVEAHVGSVPPLPPPVEYLVGYRDFTTARDYPFMCFVLARGGAVPSAGGAQDVSVTVDIGLALVTSEPADLEKILLRYVDALLNLLGENEGVGGVCDTSSVEGFDIGHGALGDKSAGTVVVTFNMQKEIQT